MAANPRIRKALFDRLGLTQPGFSRRVTRLRQQLPMSYEDAVYVLAHQNNVDIGRDLDPATLARVSGYVAQLKSTTTPDSSSTDARGQGKQKPLPKEVVVEIAGVKVGKIPGLTPGHAKEARTMAEKVYPVLYLFENSARDVITRVLKSALGDDWWKHVPLEVRNQADFNMKKAGDEAWHSMRADPIQCVDLPQLKNIVKNDKLWLHFKPFFNRKSWFESVIDDINVSRRVVAHMNPLSADDIKSVETGFRKWVKQLQAHEGEIP
jgi:hypothetical protein